jgi:hypothetical protein
MDTVAALESAHVGGVTSTAYSLRIGSGFLALLEWPRGELLIVESAAPATLRVLRGLTREHQAWVPELPASGGPRGTGGPFCA